MSRTAQLNEQLTLALPYVVIDKLATRQNVRDRKEITHGGRESWNIPVEMIEERENFNTRFEYEGILELAESMLALGQLEPIYVDVLANGKIYVERGHRRLRAINLIRTNDMSFTSTDGKIMRNAQTFALVECFINKSSMTEEMRILNLFGTNMHSKELNPLEQAEAAYRLKFCLGSELSNEEVASKLSVSRQTVDNLIIVSSAPDHIKTQIRSGDLKFTAALSLIKAEKKLKINAAKEEEKQAQSSIYTDPGYQDPLKNEMEGLEALNLQAERHQQSEKENARKEAERLERDAVIVPATKEALTDHIGKRLAAPAYFIWNDEGADNGLGGQVTVPRKEIVFEQGKEITEELINDLIHKKVETVFVFKEVQVAPSVFTEPVAEPEKSKYDLSRPELESITKAIQNVDKIEAIINKLDVPQGTKDDISYLVHWAQKNLADTREWIHKNKSQNKRGS